MGRIPAFTQIVFGKMPGVRCTLNATGTSGASGASSAASAPDDAFPLLRKLRLKFIAVNMGLAALVLAIAFVTVCYIEHRSDTDEIYRSLTEAVDRTAVQPQLVPNHNPLAPKGSLEEPGSSGSARPSPDFEHTIGGDSAIQQGNGGTPQNDGAQTSDEFAPPEIGGPHATGAHRLPIAVYYSENGTVVQLVDQSSASVAEDVLTRALAELRATNDPYGYLGEFGLFYAKRPMGGGFTAAFADGAEANAWQSLAWALAGVGAMALGALLLLNLWLSRWALGPVRRAWTQQQQFIADASHELKTPLTVILANNAILRQHAGETIASQGQWIESTQIEAERMQALVTDMLDLARPAPVVGDEAPAPIADFSHIVEGEALTFEAVAFEKGLAWETSVAPALQVAGDSRRLQRLVAVLLDNACKYTDAGGTVRVNLARAEAAAVLTVNNSGDAIDEADLPHLFDRFYRADKARTRATDSANGSSAPGGYGLGLAIARDIARAHRGTLTVASTPDAGTTFTLRLPTV